MKQKIFNEIMKSLIFATCCDVCADVPTFNKNLKVIKDLIKKYPEEFKDIDLEGIYLFGDGEFSDEPEKYKELVSIFGKKLKVEI